MKYFTTERYLALQDCSSDAALDAADAAWERALLEYDAYLDSVWPSLPATVQQLVKGFYLHDAEVLSVGRLGQELVVVLQLDPPPNELLTIAYTLAGEPAINRTALPTEHESGRPEWMHEELEVIADDGQQRFQHSIVLSNGWEIRVPFRDVQMKTAQPLLPVRHGHVQAQSA
jgi:hypothetical protein